MSKNLISTAVKLIALLFFVLAIYLFCHEIHKLGWSKVVNQLKEFPFKILILAVLLVFCDYVFLSGYDFLALRYLGVQINRREVFKTAFISFSVTNSTGHAYLAGGAIRYFFYSKVGLTQLQVIKMIAFESLTFLMGMGMVLDVCLILSYFFHIPKMHTYQGMLNFSAIVISLALFIYICFFVRLKKKFKLSVTEIKLPSMQMTFKQILLGASDIISASLVFYILFSFHLDADYLHVAVIFLIAQLIGVSTQVPGGLGVFEATFLYLFDPSKNEKASVFAVLIAFRVLYYFLPLLISCLFMLFDLCKTVLRKNHLIKHP